MATTIQTERDELLATDPDAKPRHRGMRAFLIEKEPGLASQPGLKISAPLKKLGYKGVESVELAFDGFRTPASSILGGDRVRAGARGLRQADRAASGDPAEAGADGDQDPRLRAARAGRGEAQGLGGAADLKAGMAKLSATETAQEVALEAMRVHGGYGYSLEYPVERLYRDAPLLIPGEGSNEIQQLIIARRLLERHATKENR